MKSILGNAPVNELSNFEMDESGIINYLYLVGCIHKFFFMKLVFLFIFLRIFPVKQWCALFLPLRKIKIHIAVLI